MVGVASPKDQTPSQDLTCQGYLVAQDHPKHTFIHSLLIHQTFVESILDAVLGPWDEIVSTNKHVPGFQEFIA